MRSAVWDWHYGYTPQADMYSYELYYVDHHPEFLVGKDDEITQATRIFKQHKGHNILLVGDPGSGRHALLTELAHEHINLRFLVFDIVAFLKGKKIRSEQAASLADVLFEVHNAGNVVLIINHFEQLRDFFSTIEPFLESSQVHIVGVTTPEHYHAELLVSKSLMKFVTTLTVEPLSEHELRELVKRRTAYSPWSVFPDTIITQFLSSSNTLMSLEQKGQPEAIITLIDEFHTWQRMYRKKNKSDTKLELPRMANMFLKERLNIPSAAPLSDEERLKLKNLDTLLHTRVIAQDHAIEQIVSALRRRRLQLSDINRAIGSFLFLGPTGVGKTETAKALAAIFFEDENKLLRFDMARYQNRTQIDELTDDLARAIREEPYGVLLLDEIEKSHPDLLNIFLTVIDEGYFHDSHGSKVLASNLIIIGTSNAASEYIRELSLGGEESVAEAMGTISEEIAQERRASYLQQQVVNYILTKKLYTPEFINRFDAVVVYLPLTNDHLKQIARMKIEKIRDQLQEKHQKTFTISDELIEKIVSEGTRKDFGARELDRTIDRIVEDAIANELLK